MRTFTVRAVLCSLLTGLCLYLTAPKSQAQGGLVNGSFELPGFTTPPFYRYLANGDSVTLQGWTVLDDGIGEQPYVINVGGYLVPEGSYALSLNQGSGIRTTFSVVGGTTYDLSFYAAISASAESLIVRAASLTTTFPTSIGTQTFRFTAATTDPAANLEFFNPAPPGDFKIVVLDSVQLTVVPEPGTCALLVTGLVPLFGMVARRRRV